MNSIFIFSLTSKGYVKSVVPIACFVRRKCPIVNRLEIVVNFVLVFVFTNICLFDGFLSTVYIPLIHMWNKICERETVIAPFY